MLSKEQLDQIEEKYKRVAHLKGKGEPPPWEMVLRKPTRAEYKMFRSQTHNPAQVADAQEMLVRKLCVFPVDVDALIEEWPGIPEACGKAIQHLTGLETEETGK